MTETAPTTNGWDAEFAILKSRFPKVRDTILFCLHALQQTPAIAIGDLKAQADMHGFRITGASVAGAKRLLAKQKPVADVAAEPATEAAPPTTRRRRPQREEPEVDIEAVIRSAVGQIQGQGEAKEQRLREAIRKAVEVLRVAIE